MATKFQAPKGTRDFFPEEMAVRRYIEEVWRRVSIRHGFVEVDGPTFEALDLYKVKSGDEIVSQLFHFQDRGERELALRPEFTPTVARMIAERANSLPRPIKWFSIPKCYRAEQPQKGRLREFLQWNVDVVGDTSGRDEADCIAVCVDALREFGLQQQDFGVRWNDRTLMETIFSAGNLAEERMGAAFQMLDKATKIGAEQRRAEYAKLGFTSGESVFLDKIIDGNTDSEIAPGAGKLIADAQEKLRVQLEPAGMWPFCKMDWTIVRGLAYYTGLVFEVFDRSGENRAVAGGGRYDKLIEMFGGPVLPAVGFGMGDVVLENLLREKGKLPAHLLPRPAVFVVNGLEGGAEATKLLAELRESKWDEGHAAITRSGIHAVASSKTTKNIGKLLQDAAASGARFAVILAKEEMARMPPVVKLKDLATREEREMLFNAVADELHVALG